MMRQELGMAEPFTLVTTNLFLDLTSQTFPQCLIYSLYGALAKLPANQHTKPSSGSQGRNRHRSDDW
mgnify:CR=1 FL=1